MKFKFALLYFALPFTLLGQVSDGDILDYARDRVHSGMGEQAIKELALLAEQEPQYRAACLLGQALCYAEMKQHERAMTLTAATLETEENNSNLVNRDAYWLLGNLYEISNEPEKEIAAFRKALVYDPEIPEVRLTLAFTMIKHGKAEEGVAILDQLITEGYEHSYIFNNRGLGLLKLGRLEEAKANIDRARELDEQNPFVYYNYFQYYQAKGEMSRACENLALAIAGDVEEYGIEADLELFKALQAKECGKRK